MIILKAWGVLSSSPQAFSKALSELQVNHSILGRVKNRNTSQHRVISGLCEEQPAWPVLVHSVKDLSRLSRLEKYERLIVFVFDTKASVMCTNLSPIVPSEDNLVETIKYALTNVDREPFVLQHYSPTMSDFVAMATKPSVLNELQTAYYKINPYAQRKVVQKAVILYLGGSIGLKAVSSVLKTTLRGEDILTMLRTTECKNLVDAIKAVKGGLALDKAGAKFNIDAFDVSYVLTSEKKLGEET